MTVQEMFISMRYSAHHFPREIIRYVILLYLFRQSPGQLPYGYVPLKYLRLGLFDAKVGH